MTPAEWARVAVEIQARWPQREIPEESWEIWFDDLRSLDAELVRTAVRALYLDGREWCPNGARILAKALELSDPQADIDHGEAWRLAKRASLKADELAGHEWLSEQCPAAAEVVRRLCGGITLTYLLDDESTVRAQFRDVYKNVVAAHSRDARYQAAGLPAPAPRSLGTGPRQFGAVLTRALPPAQD